MDTMYVTESKTTVLVTADLDRSVHFYQEVLGLELIERTTDEEGNEQVRFKAGGLHPDIILVSDVASGPVKQLSVDIPNEKELREVYKRSLRNTIEIVGLPAANVMPALYLIDPNGNTVEAGIDLPPISVTNEEWSSILWSTAKWLMQEEQPAKPVIRKRNDDIHCRPFQNCKDKSKSMRLSA